MSDPARGTALEPAVAERLARQGRVHEVTPLSGGRGGRTFRVEHRAEVPGGPATTSVLHLRTGGASALSVEVAAARRAHACGVGPEVLDVDPGLGLLLTRWVPGRALAAADLRRSDLLDAVGRAVARLHAAPVGPVGPVDPDDLQGADLPRLDPLAVRRDYLRQAAHEGIDWQPDVQERSAYVDRLAARLEQEPAGVVGVHGDLVPANLVLRSDRAEPDGPDAPDGRVAVLDHEYAGLADPAFDLGGLVATAELDAAATARLVEAYLADPAAPAVRPERVTQWRDVVAHAWFVWVALGADLGPQAEHWRGWAQRQRASWGPTR